MHLLLFQILELYFVNEPYVKKNNVIYEIDIETT